MEGYTSIDKKAEDLARRLQCATEVLLERLFVYLSRLPEEDSDEVDGDNGNSVTTTTTTTTNTNTQSQASGSGMTLPAAAIGWLSSQYYPPETEEVCPTIWSSVALTDRLRLLRFLLPRVTHLRITRQPWPPEIPKTLKLRQRSSSSRLDTSTIPTAQEPPEELNCSGMSVNSALTVEESIPRTTRQAFWRFMQGLEHHPSLNMKIFPRLQVLVLDSIPPSWVSHLSSLQPTLQVLKWNKACLYNDLPRLFANQQPSTVQNDSSSSTPARILPPPSSQLYSHLTHLDLSSCGIGEASGLSKVLSRCVRNIQCLSLSHNDLVTQKAAISGLRRAENLIKLNLSYNNLTALPQAHLYLGGQLQRLQLSHNHLTTVQGIDRLYALQELWLDHNQIVNLSELAGICQLPQLQLLQLQGNPLELDYPYYPKQIWTWFQEFRQATTPQELPLLNSLAITCEQWNALVLELPPTIPQMPRKVQRPQPRRKARILLVPALYPTTATTMTTLNGFSIRTRQQQRRQRSQSPTLPGPDITERPRVSFSLVDVLSSLRREETKEEESIIVPSSDVAPPLSVKKDMLQEEEDYDDEHEELMANPAAEPILPTLTKTEPDLDTQDTADLTASTNTKEEFSHGIDDVNSSSPLSVTLEETELITTTGSTTAPTGSASGGESTKERTVVTNPTGANRPFDVMTADWDDLVQKVARGMIPDGKPRVPIPELVAPLNNSNGTAFPEEAAELLAPTPRESMATKWKEPRKGDAFVMDTDEHSVATSTMPFHSNSLPEQIYPDDFSVPSSLGTNRDDFPLLTSKFQIAEENAVYDGPASLSDMDVLENLKMYFETYVFPMSTTAPSKTDAVEADDEDDVDDWQTVVKRYPRLQLFPEDRRIQEAASLVQATTTAPLETDDGVVTQERFVRVWEEQVVPCGKLALRRLAPNRRIRLGFHGDQLYKEGAPDPYAECRRVYLCLSSAAFYIILRADDVTKKQEEKGMKTRFPNPIPNGSTFADAPWPHAVARHTFQELQKITIGFEFQRLILQFSNPAIRKTDPFVYVLLTCNKKATVSILQEIQRLVKESKRETIDLNADVAPVAIENDSQTVMDAIQASLTPEIVGTILHYQILQQRWKHGEERGTVRRICLVTDSKLYLMDEDYHADAHQPLDPSSTTTPGATIIRKKKGQVDLARVSYRLVDQANLKQVAEVQAAGADPTAITIVINPLSRLSRTHRWRLLCRDSEGAERLVEDVRKAMAMIEE